MFTALAVLGFTFANAQEGSEGFANGDIFISGAFSYDSETEGDFKSSTFEVAPRVGFFVSENFALGGKIGYASTKLDNGIADATDSTLSLGAFGRYYFSPASKFSLFGELGFDYISIDSETAGDIKVNGYVIAAGPGVSYFLNNNFALEAFWGAIGYGSAKPDVDGAESTDVFTFGADLRDISLGLVYKF